MSLPAPRHAAPCQADTWLASASGGRSARPCSHRPPPPEGCPHRHGPQAPRRYVGSGANAPQRASHSGPPRRAASARFPFCKCHPRLAVRACGCLRAPRSARPRQLLRPHVLLAQLDGLEPLLPLVGANGDLVARLRPRTTPHRTHSASRPLAPIRLPCRATRAPSPRHPPRTAARPGCRGPRAAARATEAGRRRAEARAGGRRRTMVAGRRRRSAAGGAARRWAMTSTDDVAQPLFLSALSPAGRVLPATGSFGTSSRP